MSMSNEVKRAMSASKGRELVQQAKARGDSAEAFWAMVKAIITRKKWRPSEKAAALADWLEDVRAVYGEEAANACLPKGKPRKA